MLDSPPTLTGRLVRLEPLSAAHHDGLVDATTDGAMWDRWYTSAPTPHQVQSLITQRLALQREGSNISYVAVRVGDNTTVGMTSFYDVRPDVPRVSIGYTWNRESAHGTGTNPESKLLLLTHAFETMDCAAVRFETSWANQQSRAAIERLGARLDGVLRADRRERNGSLRDTVVYSVLRHEWPSVRSGLEHRLRHR